MADQKTVTLYEGHATPKNIILRALPVADAVTTTIYLYQGHAEAKNIVLRDPTDAPEAGGAVNATSAHTEANDTLAAAASLSINATLAATDADDALVATGSLQISAALAATEAGDSLSATASLSINATLAVTEADDALAATGSLSINASAAITEEDDTLAADAELGALPDEGGHAGQGYGAKYWRTVRRLRARKLRELYEEVREADPGIAAVEEIAAIVEPYAPRAPIFKLPAPAQVDWAAMAADAEARLRTALVEAMAQIEADDEEALLLLAA